MAEPRLLSVPLILVSATLFLGALAPNLLVLAPRYLAGRGFDEQEIGIVMGSFNIAMLVNTPIVGRLIGRLGHRSMLVIGCSLAAIGSLLFAAAGTTLGYSAARVVQGTGFAAVLVTSAAYVAVIAPPRRLAQALGISGILTLCSQATGPFAGELIEGVAGWSWVFIAGGIGAGAGALVAACLPPASDSSGGVGDGRIGAFPTLVVIGLAGFGFGSVWTFLADYADRVGIDGVTPFFAPYVAAAIATRLLFGHLADRLGRVTVAVPALAIHGLALFLLAGLAASWQLATIGGLFGLAHGFYYPALMAMVIERSPVSPSRALAAGSFCFGAGVVTSAFGLGTLAEQVGYPPIYLVAGAAGAVAAVVVLIRG